MSDTAAVPAPSSVGGLLRGWRTRDIVVAAALAVPLGLIWSYGWGFLWVAGSGILPEIGLFLDGFYVVGGVLVGYIIRRPGAALLGEMLAAFVEIPFTPFGVIVLWLGSFRASAWKLSSWPPGIGTSVCRCLLLLAGAAGSAVMFFGYEYVAYSYDQLAAPVQALRFGVKLLGGIILAGLIGKLIADALAQTGALNNFPIGRERQREI